MTPQDKAHPPTSSSMEEVAAKRPEEVIAITMKKEPQEAKPQSPLATPPQSALRADSSSIEEERGEWLLRRAKEMRKKMTPHEKAIWRLLREGELVALNWRRQVVFRKYILDFVSHPARIVVEIDGAQHGTREQSEHDTRRSADLNSQGYRVLRFWNNEAVRNRDGVWRTINAAAQATPARARMERWRREHLAHIQEQNARLTSSSMEEVAAKRPEEVRAIVMKEKPPEAQPQTSRATPPQSALRADSSSIEEEH